jgi:DNA (cytosine-5)-methyltransferase 1
MRLGLRLRLPGGGGLMSLTVTDLFCGAGGSSSGAESVAGVRVRMASNHWDLAIACHNQNLPHVDHDIADISGIDPRRYPSTDLLWASPSCTFWSQARGERCDFADQPEPDPTLFDLTDTADFADQAPLPDAARERSRALMHDVPRFAEYHRYKAVIVENTPPLLKWSYFTKWIARMRALGYQHRVLTLNSAFAHQLGAPAPQLRDRAYVVFWQERYPAPDFDRWTRPRAWCPTCGQIVTAMYAAKNPRRPHGSYWQQYLYRCPKLSCRHGIAHPYTLPALAAIDLANPGRRIGDRAEPLAPKTMIRIAAGIARHAHPNTAERRPGARHTTASNALAVPPLLIPVEGREGKNARTAWALARAQTGRNETALLVPAGGTWNTDAWPAAAPMRTRTTRDTEALVTITSPVMVPLRNNNRAKQLLEPLDTVAANGNHHGLALLLRNNGDGNAAPGWQCTPISEPARTITTSGHQSLVWHPHVLFAYDTGAFRALSRPSPTQTTVEGDALLQLGAAVEDCHFRMLDSEEIKLGMAFTRDFQLLGTQRERVRMCGNAVTPPVARDLIAAVAEAITGEATAA